MKVLLLVFSPSTGTFGSLTRIMALAKAFQASDHSVSFCASGYIANTIESKGFSVFAMPEPTLFGLPAPIARIIEKRSQSTRLPVQEGKSIGSIWFVYAITGMLKTKFLQKLVAAQLTVIDQYKPDLLVTEMDPGSYLTARIANIPLVTTYAKVSDTGHGTHFWKKTKKAINAVLAEHGNRDTIEPEQLLENQKKTLRIIPSIPELDGTDPHQENLRYVGNLLEPIHDGKNAFDFDRSKRYIFIYVGTGSISLDRVKKIVPQAFNIYPSLECLVAAQSIKSEYIVGNTRFLPYVPVERVLPYCDAVICHGGLNTITQSLEGGVPLILFPGPIFERRYNAHMVVKNGAGAMGELSDFTIPWLRSRYEERGRFAGNAAELQKKFKEYSGATGAVKKIFAWLD